MLYIQGGFRQRPEKSERLRTMTLSWKIFQTEGTSSKKVLKQVKKCLTYLRNSQPEAIVQRVRRVLRDGVKEMMVVGEIKC